MSNWRVVLLCLFVAAFSMMPLVFEEALRPHRETFYRAVSGDSRPVCSVQNLPTVENIDAFDFAT